MQQGKPNYKKHPFNQTTPDKESQERREREEATCAEEERGGRGEETRAQLARQASEASQP